MSPPPQDPQPQEVVRLTPGDELVTADDGTVISAIEATSPRPSRMSDELQNSILVAYRSAGLGTFGALMRLIGMPLEKIALFMNSSQVTGKNQFAQSIKLTFKGGPLAPYRVVGPASMVAWFMQYSGKYFFFMYRFLDVHAIAPACHTQQTDACGAICDSISCQ